MTYKSILFYDEDFRLRNDEPVFFTDLNLDQIIGSVTSGKEEYNLKPFFYTGQLDSDTIIYRQQIMQDIENRDVCRIFEDFAASMRNIRARLLSIEKFYYKYQKARLYMDLIKFYVETVMKLVREMASVDLKSEGLLTLGNYLEGYITSPFFINITSEIQRIESELASVNYCVVIQGLRVQVKHYIPAPDYSAEVESVFSRFKEGTAKNYLVKLNHYEMMNDIEAQILDGVASLYPDYFLHLEQFVTSNADFQDAGITVLDREIQFFLSWFRFIEKFRSAGLSYCYPVVSAQKEVEAFSVFDMALADKLISENKEVVVNDFYLQDRERLLVITGPNQGGKTTFARTFGQLHYFASLGCPVSGTHVRLFQYDQLFTHFGKEEKMKSLRGKLQDELWRIHEIFQAATGNSLIVINEIFTSTTLHDQLYLSAKIINKLIQLDIVGVWVTFIDELADYCEKTVSMVSQVVPEDTSQRTFKIVRKPADGLAYALSIAEKYHLTYELLTKRLWKRDESDRI